jgi:hypothetical protein
MVRGAVDAHRGTIHRIVQTCISVFGIIRQQLKEDRLLNV